MTAGDITASLKAGISDFLARPVMSGFFGLFYAVFGILFVWCLVWLGQIWMIIPCRGRLSADRAFRCCRAL